MRRILKNSDAGMVSIIVTLIMMLVITLIVTGFTQVTRHSQREALDSQLGTQAYYAAETGVNDAVSYINAQLEAGSSVSAVTDCKGSPGLPVPRTLTTNVSYTCLMVNPNPKSITVKDITTTSSQQEHLQDLAGTFKTLTFSWKPPTDVTADASQCGSALGTYPTADNWTCPHGILRVDIYHPTGGYDANSLAANTTTVYMQPVQSANPPAAGYGVSFGGNKKAVQAACTPDAAGFCNVKLDVSGANSGEYYVRMSTIYQDSAEADITGTDSAGATKFANGQYVVDSTGRAQDELKRIQVRVPVISNSASLPAFGVQSTNTICKDISIQGTTVNNNSCTSPDIWPTGAVSFNCVTQDDMVLTLDASSSMTDQWETGTRETKLKQVATTFLDNIDLGVSNNHVGVVSFDSNATINSSLSYDKTQLASAINGITNSGGTNYTAALNAANSMLTAGRPAVKKTMIFISDGNADGPNDTDAGIEAYVNNMKLAGVEVYTIGVTLQNDSQSTALLTAMSGNGGSYYSAASEQQLSDFFNDIVAAEQC